MVFTLPYPPSINHYWRRVGYRTLISREGRIFRAKVCSLLGRSALSIPSSKRLTLVLDLYPPDKRRRDLDNIQKPVLDALEHAGVYFDDSQIDQLLTRRCEATPGGKLVVEIIEMPLEACPTCGKELS